MTREQVRAILEQAAAALASQPETPATYSEEDRAMLKEIHAAVVNPPSAPSSVPASVPLFMSIPQSSEPPLEAPAEPKKKSFWAKLGSGVKTTLVAIGAGGGGAALNAAVDAVQHGNISPTGIATAAVSAAVAGAIGYRAQSPVPKGE